MTFLDNPLFIPAVIFGAILFVFYAIRMFTDLRRKNRSIHDRATRWGVQADRAYEEDDSQGLVEGRASKRLFRRFRFSGKKKEKKGEGIYSNTAIDFQRAGMYNPFHIRTYQVARVLLAILPFLGFFVYLVLTGKHFTTKGGVIVAYIGVIFFLIPMFWMKHRVKKRKQEFEKAFPNAMDLLVVCVEAGMGFDAAIARVSKEMEISSPMLAREFKILSLELKTGKPRNECMGNLAKRINLSDVDNLVNLLVQAEKFGTGIAHPLRIHAEEMREKRYNRMEELAAKLPVKLSFPLVLFIFPAMMIALIGPAIIQVYRLFILR